MATLLASIFTEREITWVYILPWQFLVTFQDFEANTNQNLITNSSVSAVLFRSITFQSRRPSQTVWIYLSRVSNSRLTGKQPPGLHRNWSGSANAFSPPPPTCYRTPLNSLPFHPFIFLSLLFLVLFWFPSPYNGAVLLLLNKLVFFFNRNHVIK